MSLTLDYNVTSIDNHSLLGEFLTKQHFSRKAVIALKHRGGKIIVNNEEKTTRFKLTTGDKVTVIFANESVSNKLLPVRMKFLIIYEDEFLLVVDKVVGLPVIPTGSHDVGLANGILAYYQEIGLGSTVHFVNRLDKDTSGLLIIAKHRHIHHLMTEQHGSIIRKYYALISGVLVQGCKIDAPLYRPVLESIKRIVHSLGKQAVTNVEIVQHFENQTLVSCTLETGRTHQIRVHMAHIGHPIIADPLYGTGKPNDQQMLHSYALEFVHPITGVNLRFQTEVPKRFGIT